MFALTWENKSVCVRGRSRERNGTETGATDVKHNAIETSPLYGTKIDENHLKNGKR